jgi:[methyl-Co(III) methanol-specific corrinoid protein]:coenzyme M methyltransferase
MSETNMLSHLGLMSPKRRFLTSLLGGKSDRVPVGNVVSVVTVEQMRMVNAWFPEAHSNPEVMARLAAAGHEILGFDTVMPVFSVVQEAAALGCQIDWGDQDNMPTVRTHPFAETASFRLAEGWLEAPSIQVVLQALRLLRQRLGDRVAIVGKVMGPWTLSYHMMGVEEFLITTKLDPARSLGSMQALKNVTLTFARAQIQAGADIICLADHATGGMISPSMYRDMLLPLHQEIFAAIGAPSVLHCCGNTTDRVKFFAESGVDCFHFESQVNLETAVAAARGKMTLMGNINNPTLLLTGSRTDVLRACRQAIDGGVQILSPECAVPLYTPIQNLQALVEAASLWVKDPG